MMMSKEHAKRAIIPILYRVRGQHRRLIAHLDDMPVDAINELFYILREMQDDVHRAERKVRLWPDGPKIKV